MLSSNVPLSVTARRQPPASLLPRRRSYPDFLTMVLPQQHVGLCCPAQSGGAPLVTVTSQPQDSSGQR